MFPFVDEDGDTDKFQEVGRKHDHDTGDAGAQYLSDTDLADPLFGAFPEQIEVYRHCSPIYNVRQAQTPTLVLHGDEDSVVPFKWGEELAQVLPNATFVRLEGAGHNFLVAQREKANTAVLDFIGKVES